jgi:2-polyprenyl-3-methyl-5-hydroxy-6-metoxy-1,4-benzoquinol methylase
MSTLHRIATSQYTEHYARMNPTLDPAQMTERLYRNMELMFGRFVRALPKGSLVADLGCGTGFLLYWLARHKNVILSGVDASDSQAELARRAVSSAQIECGDLVAFLKERPGEFSGLFCMDTLEHLETAEDCFEALQAIEAALKPGGFFICRVPNAAHVLGSYSRYMDITHHRSFTSHSLKQALRAAGFTQIELIPTQSSILLGKTRLMLEKWFHRALFLLGGYTMEDTFTQNVIAVGYKAG